MKEWLKNIWKAVRGFIVFCFKKIWRLFKFCLRGLKAVFLPSRGETIVFIILALTISIIIWDIRTNRVADDINDITSGSLKFINELGEHYAKNDVYNLYVELCSNILIARTSTKQINEQLGMPSKNYICEILDKTTGAVDPKKNIVREASYTLLRAADIPFTDNDLATTGIAYVTQSEENQERLEKIKKDNNKRIFTERPKKISSQNKIRSQKTVMNYMLAWFVFIFGMKEFKWGKNIYSRLYNPKIYKKDKNSKEQA